MSKMKKQLKILTLLSVCQLFCGCFAVSYLKDSPKVKIKKDFDGNGIAVLSFAKQGSALPHNIGMTAADKVTDALFLSGGYNVIDRSQVNSAQQEMEVENVEFLSSDQIQQIGLKLKANYIVLGRIHSLKEKENFNVKSDQEIAISFRIISVKDTEVIGVADYKQEMDEEIVNNIDRMINKIVDRIQIK